MTDQIITMALETNCGSRCENLVTADIWLL